MNKRLNLRSNSRRLASDRRTEDRRKIPHAFNSEEWLNNIKHHYLAWPKYDRRIAERRSEDRRVTERRLQIEIKHQQQSNQLQMILTPEEREMIAHLYLNDDELV